MTRRTDEELIAQDTQDLRDEIETIEARIWLMELVAETGEQWAEICRIEQFELMPLKRHLEKVERETETAIDPNSQFGVGA